jgi:hypothetical protein
LHGKYILASNIPKEKPAVSRRARIVRSRLSLALLLFPAFTALYLLALLFSPTRHVCSPVLAFVQTSLLLMQTAACSVLSVKLSLNYSLDILASNSLFKLGGVLNVLASSVFIGLIIVTISFLIRNLTSIISLREVSIVSNNAASFRLGRLFSVVT